MTFIESLKGRYKDVIEFASELGERFPDLNNYQIVLACSEYTGKDISENSVLAYACVEAYGNGEAASL